MVNRQLFNIEKSIHRGESPKGPLEAIRYWMQDHLRFLWNLMMMLVLLFICVWAATVAGSGNPSGAIIEEVAPELSEDPDAKLEDAVRSAANP